MIHQAIDTIDLHFMGFPGTIASYLIPYAHGVILVECGPSSTLPALQAGLKAHGFSVKDVTDVLLTHIHLDHAGAAGWLARQGARVYVHPAGAAHMRNPEKLLASAARIYGDAMQTLWGDFLPVPPECLLVPQDGDDIQISNLHFRPVDTPGHADHHFSYLFDDVCFSGDIGGVRLAGLRHIRLPMPPPDFHPGKWRQSVEKLSRLPIRHIAPTHFGIFDDPDWHFNALAKALDEIETWIEATMPSDPPIEALNEQFISWSRRRSLEAGVSPDAIDAYETSNPSWMSTYGIQRYWRKFRLEKTESA